MNTKKKLYVFFEIILLVVTIFSVAWVVQSELKVVSAGRGDLQRLGWAWVSVLWSRQNFLRQIYTYDVELWQPSGEQNNCEECNKLIIAGKSVCSEYICHSYGPACEWITETGAEEYDKCAEIERGDRSPPNIFAINEIDGKSVLPDSEKYSYVPTGDSGYRVYYDSSQDRNANGEIIDTNGCIPPFTSITLAVGTDENAQCKISSTASKSGNPNEIFNSMESFMEESTGWTTTHTLRLPSSVLADPRTNYLMGTISEGNTYQFYIRCKDRRQNANPEDYIVGFCIYDGPNAYAPRIEGTNPPEGSYIPHTQTEINPFTVYTNEPAKCRWDIEPRTYDYMRGEFGESEGEDCTIAVGTWIDETNRYGCKGVLEGFIPGQDNTYYISCRDMALAEGTGWGEQVMTSPAQAITFKGSQELVIADVRINGELNGSLITAPTGGTNIEFTIKTLGGADSGKSKCYYSNDPDMRKELYPQFYNNGEWRNYLTENTESFFLKEEGNYNYYVFCEDEAGNSAPYLIYFDLEIDDKAPEVIRVYKDGNQLKLITNEISDCYYTNYGCIYDPLEEGVDKMHSGDKKTHVIDWNTEDIFYIKCLDSNNLGPRIGDECTIRISGFEMVEVIEA